MPDKKPSFVSDMIRIFSIMSLVVLGFCSSLSYSQTATAVDQEQETEDAIVMNKIIKNQQQNNAQTKQSTPAQQSASPASDAVANDMQEGQTERQLPTLNEPIIDQANLLNPQDKQALSQQIKALHDQGKAQIGIIIVPTTGQEDIFDYAMRVAQAWKLGSKAQDNGLLMAIAVNDHKIQILSGYGLEGVLPDVVLSRIIRNQITPYFKQNQYTQGIQAGITEISNILNQDPEVAQKAAQELKERQEQALHEQQAKENTLTTVAIILIVGIFASFIVGNRISAATAGVAACAAGLIYGSGIVMSLIMGVGVFFLLITSIAQLIFQMFLSGGGRGGGGRGGGFSGGGGYSGGGGSFGGGGASGSW
ncbi:TPM domain-containing protein [Acinetobacter gerneri]|uniref:TPM domain-containing protein n=1 Tax=Acinetobacter gerneri TaxID=202952 RepID=UPI003D1FDAAE